MVKIEKILGVDQWENDHGVMYCFKLLLSDGRNGEVNAKTNDRYQEGDEVWIIDEKDGKYGFKWRLSKQDPSANSYGSNGQNTSSNKDLEITASWAIGQALGCMPDLIEDEQALLKQAAKLMLVRQNLIEQ
jgi:hypothetical protein